MHENALEGCRPTPLAAYLKALGVLRLVGEQADREARGFWRGEVFVLRSSLDEAAVLSFFLQQYRPTPVIAPWNGGSGFYASDNQSALRAIAGSSADRLADYRHAIASATALLDAQGLRSKPTKPEKAILLEACRGRLADRVLAWSDAAYLMTHDGPKFPPLLGTGGNDGRLDFTNNFMQRLLDVLAASGEPTRDSPDLLKAALFDEATGALGGGSIGQFMPGGAGGANAGAGFEGDARVNPWNFVLMIEGAVAFSAAAVRRMAQDTEGALSYPFTVQGSAAGYASAAGTDTAKGASRGEMWLPLWTSPARLPEVLALFAEGRARVSGRAARNGVDFARAVAALGVDRGFSQFQRYGLQVRNGLSYLAVPLDRYAVHEQPSVRRLDAIDAWLSTLRRRAGGDRAPATVRRAAAALDEAVLELCRRGGPDRVQAVLVALGACERALSRSLSWASDPRSGVGPVPPLEAAWLLDADDGTSEFRLAVALASVSGGAGRTHLPLRRQLEPVTLHPRQGRSSRVEWDKNARRDVVWQEGSLPAALNAVLARRLVTFQRQGTAAYPDRGVQSARISDVAAFVEGRVDDARLASLLWGTVLVDWPRVARAPLASADEERATPSALYGLLKACFAGGESPDGPSVRLVPRIHRLAAAGDGGAAARAAAQRLRASGLDPAVRVVPQRGDVAIRTAAAVLFPLSLGALAHLHRSVLRPKPHPGEIPS